MSLEIIINNETKKSFLDRLRNRITLYILSLSILAGAYFVDLPKSFSKEKTKTEKESVGYIGGLPWMLQPVGARASAMGEGFVAVIDNAHTSLWNPGAIAFVDGLNFSYTYNPFVTSEKINYLSFLKGIKRNLKFGINYCFLESEDYSDLFTRIESENYFFGISLGYKIKNFGLGLNTKYVYSKLGDFKDNTIAVDIGTFYSKKNKIKEEYPTTFNAGLSLSNITGSVDFGTNRSESLPEIFKIGYSITSHLPKKENKFIPLSLTHNFEYSDILNTSEEHYWDYKSLGFGVEVLMYEILALRMGYHYQKGDKRESEYNKGFYTGFTHGIGINLPIHYFKKSIPLSINYNWFK